MTQQKFEFIAPEPGDEPDTTFPAEFMLGSDVDECALKARALQLWSDHDRCVDKLAPILYELCAKLNAQGKKGKGFRAWLKESGKLGSKSTAYRWIREYAEKNDLELPYSNPPKSKPTSSHVGQGAKAVAQPTSANISNPAWAVSQMNVPEQITLLGIGSFADVLKNAEQLIETPGEEFTTAAQSSDPNSHDVTVYGDPNYHWTPPDNGAEMARAQAYMAALKTVLKALNYEAKRARSLINHLEDYIKKLNDVNQPSFFQSVPKAKASMEQPLAKKTA